MAKVNPSKQLEQAARIAIVVLAVGSPERIALAKALNALKPATAKPVSKKKLVYVVDHSMNCYCEACMPTRELERGACALQTGLMASVGTLQVWSYREAFKPENAPRKWDKSAMELCACGHKAESHREDEMNNLLACDAYIRELSENCTCDHFHYQIEDEAA